MAFNNHNNLDVMDTNLPRVELKCEDSSENEVPECRCLQVKNMRSGAARNIDDRGSKRQQHTKHVAETGGSDGDMCKVLIYSWVVPNEVKV